MKNHDEKATQYLAYVTQLQASPQSYPRVALGIASLMGGLLVFAFAPFALRPLAVIAPAGLLFLWWDASPAQIFWRGYVFGLAFFGAGVSWVYNSIFEFGHAPAPVAASIMLIFVLFLALYPALTGILVTRLSGHSKTLMWLVAFPAIWTLLEWLRSWIFTGFPWLLLGQAHVDTPLAGMIPVLGVLGATWFSAFTSAALVYFLKVGLRARALLIGAVALLWLGSMLIGKISWVEDDGLGWEVSLIQGNVPQDVKWDPGAVQDAMDLYSDLTREHWSSDLIIWPESAIPAFYSEVKDRFFLPLAEEAALHGTRVLTGAFYSSSDTGEAYNSLILIGETPRVYHKRHLVPFGEYMPFRGLLAWLNSMIDIPMSDLAAGRDAPVMSFGDHKMGLSICYEDAYGNEIIDALPQANFLVNVSNDAWFGDSLAPHQHLEIARLRALETGRYLLRATNTGISAIIGPDGRVVARSPQFETHVLTAKITSFSGLTPFSRWGNWTLVTLAFAVLLLTYLRLHRIRHVLGYPHRG